MKVKNNRIKKKFIKFFSFSVGARIVLILYFLFFLLEAFLHLMQVFFVLNNAFKSTYDPLNFLTVQPELFTVQNFLNVFTLFRWAGVGYWQMLFNSIWTSVLYLVVNIGSSTLLAYGLAKFRFPGRNFLYGLLLFIQTIPILGGGAADFKLRNALNMVNNPATLWLSWAMGFDYTCFILYGIFQGISRSYAESAEIDGASQLKIFTKIMFPQAFPAILAMAVTNLTTRWNDYTTSQLYLSNYPNLAFALYQFQNSGNTSTFSGGKLTYFASLLCAGLPVVVIYLASQGLILRNIAVGGLKG